MPAEIATLFDETGLSHSGVVMSTGVETHLARLARGEVSADTLRQYAQNLKSLNDFTNRVIPVDYWDVPYEDVSEYEQVAKIVTQGEYVRLLARAFVRFKAVKEDGDNAVNTAIALLGLAADYIVSHEIDPLLDIRGDTPQKQAIYLWQRLLTGTTRTVRWRKTYTHGVWARHNVVEIYTYAMGEYIHHEDAWGVSGFQYHLVGDFERNRNQVEHLGISAVVQHVVTPGIWSWIFLNVVEIGQLVLLREVNFAQARADIGINNISWRALQGFDPQNPGLTQTRLREQLQGPPIQDTEY